MADLDSSSPDRRVVPPAAVPVGGLGMAQAGLIAIAVLYFARDLLIPLALAILLSFVLAPIARALRKLRVPRPAAVLAAVVLAAAILASLGLVIGRQLTDLAADLPFYRGTITMKLQELHAPGRLVERATELLRDIGQGMQQQAEQGTSNAAQPGPPGADPARAADQLRPLPVEVRTPPPTPAEAVQQVLLPLVHPLAMTGIVIVLVIFILLYREDLRDRVIRLIGARDLHRTVAAMDDAAYRLSRFFLAQTAMNATYGVFITAALLLIGVPQPVLWGILAGLMRFVPFVGSFIAVAFPALLALAVDPGWSMLLWVLVLFTISEVLMGQLFEPLIFGHSTGLSPIAVIAAATFWTWLWGPIGLLVAVPLTVCLVVLGRHVEQLEFLDVMLGDRPPLDPSETFYQRALAGDADALVEQADMHLRHESLSHYYETVALPGIRLAQSDALRAALAPSRLNALRTHVGALVEDLADEDDTAPMAPIADSPAKEETGNGGATEEAHTTVSIPDGWREPGAVLCVAGRGPFDDLSATIIAQLLEKRGLGARVVPPDAVRLPNLAQLEPKRVRLICMCALEGGSSAATARYVLRRMRRRLPDVPIVAGVLCAGPEAAVPASLRAEGTAEVRTSLRSLIAACVRLAARDAAAPAMADQGRSRQEPAV